jgi:acyl-CoA synthetase (AMP-forming)/AMP-acid ligase II
MIFRSPWPDIQLPSGSVCDAVLGAAKRYGNKVAVIQGETGQTLSYAELIRGAQRVAAGLACAGLKSGQALALALPNSIEFVLAWFGTLLTGAFVVPINPLYTQKEMKSQVSDSGARFLITTAECAEGMEEQVERLFVTGGNWDELLTSDAPPPEVHIKPDDLAAMPYSSGTTGKPKGVMLTHANIVSNIFQLHVVDWPCHEDVIVNIFPLYHVAGLNCMLNTFLEAGATLVLMKRFDLQLYLTLNERYSATFLGCPPPVILLLTKSPECAGFPFSHFRRAVCGAAPLGAEAHEAFEQRTGLLLRQAWGMSEATAVISTTPNDRAKRKLGSCGQLLPSVQAQIVDTVSLKALGVGEAGEIWLRGPHIMQGYWKQSCATSETLIGEGWMRTGDIGYFDVDNYVYLVDRLKEMIKYNALQVSPAELEDIIQSHPAVFDVAVVGMPHPSAGEIPKAFVVRKEGANLEAEELMRYVAAHVAPYKKVRAVEFIREIPKSPSGKILRRILRDKVS